MSLDALGAAVANDRAAGRVPFCVIGTAGTTNTATVDPLVAIADLCEREALWFHVDGAYGAAAALAPTARRLLDGMHRAHSLAVDPHKWLFQPIEMGCCLVRDERWLAHTFSERPEYLQDTWADLEPEQEVNFCERGIQLTRAFRALKLWMTLKVFGEEALSAAIERGIANARAAEQIIHAHGCFEIVTPAQLGVITFRYRSDSGESGDSNALTRAIFDANRERGFSMLTTTTIRGHTVLRLCTINPRTTHDDIEQSVALLARIGRELQHAHG